MSGDTQPIVEQLVARAFTVPTDAPEADGTLSWDATTIVVVEARACGHTGLGYSYAAAAAAPLISELLAAAVLNTDALSPPGAWSRMRSAVRNVGYPGVASSAISAVDVALWDLKGSPAWCRAQHAAWACARAGAGVWQRRVHLL
jgi:L-alanine-DL-glutamate epimerase-like enolase superfamily enzyme